ncbi:MAG: hypothetical protein AAB328_12705, partial [candidate division NC10 bacterium]
MGVMRRLLFRAFGLTFLAERWIRRRFTTAGLLALGATAAAAVVGLDTNRTLAYQAFTFLVALLAVAMAASLSFRGRFSVRRLLPRFATAGEPLILKLGTREAGMFIDRLVFSTSDALTEAEFNALAN